MRYVFFFSFLVICWPVWGVAQRVESLSGLGSVVVEEAGTSFDDAFARTLEKQGFLESALLEWQRVAFVSQNPHVQRRALWQTGVVAQKLGRYDVAIASFKQFAEKFPNDNDVPEVWYRIGLLADSLQLGAGDAARRRLAQLAGLTPNTNTEKAENGTSAAPEHTLAAGAAMWHQRLVYAYAWQLAEQGLVLPKPAEGDTRLATLQQQVKNLQHRQKVFVLAATTVGVVPGLGHIYVGNWRLGAPALLVAVVLLWALMFALRHKHRPYVAVWALLFVSFYGFVLSDLRHRLAAETAKERLTAMAGWTHLYPDTWDMPTPAAAGEGPAPEQPPVPATEK